ncbi:unnamed protein product [Pieris brassicae]|uniref:Uncharacterized protein n=1 Tax=Pieris brassicae TaxID=7116 RepID=A0A9P0XDG9_PIEBR|nr:unnamed protein product [Pieris brassicae]
MDARSAAHDVGARAQRANIGFVRLRAVGGSALLNPAHAKPRPQDVQSHYMSNFNGLKTKPPLSNGKPHRR